MKEADIQRDIRKAIAPHGTYFRANVGQAWTGEEVIHLGNGDVLIKEARPFSSGLPKGFPDIFGFTMCAGKPIFTAIEVKTPQGRIRPEQAHMIVFLQSRKAIAGVARSAIEAVNLITDSTL